MHNPCVVGTTLINLLQNHCIQIPFTTLTRTISRVVWIQYICSFSDIVAVPWQAGSQQPLTLPVHDQGGRHLTARSGCGPGLHGTCPSTNGSPSQLLTVTSWLLNMVAIERCRLTSIGIPIIKISLIIGIPIPTRQLYMKSSPVASHTVFKWHTFENDNPFMSSYVSLLAQLSGVAGTMPLPNRDCFSYLDPVVSWRGLINIWLNIKKPNIQSSSYIWQDTLDAMPSLVTLVIE